MCSINERFRIIFKESGLSQEKFADKIKRSRGEVANIIYDKTVPKDKIIEAYGEEWWLQLVSIFLQHHGEFGDECKTMASYLVHKCDLLESQLTSIGQALEAPISSTAGDRIKQDGLWLSI